MIDNIQYISDQNGKTTAVVIPLKDWITFKKEHTKLQNISKLKTGLADAFREFDKILKGEIKAVTLSKFLNEN
jgi:hypothetical protein